jgi:hypothetical protein
VLNPVFPNPDQQTQTIGGKQLRSVNYGHRVAGVGYGSYARVLLSPLLEQLESRSTTEPQRDSFQRQETFIEGSQPLSQKKTLSSVETRPSLSVLEANPELLWQVVGKASTLVSQIKSVIGDH